jgi:hypothetical protein
MLGSVQNTTGVSKMKIAFCFASFLLLSGPATAQEINGTIGDFTARDAADGLFGKAGDLRGTREERGERIHNQQTEDRLQQIERNQGETGRLRAEQEYRRTHSR